MVQAQYVALEAVASFHSYRQRRFHMQENEPCEVKPLTRQKTNTTCSNNRSVARARREAEMMPGDASSVPYGRKAWQECKAASVSALEYRCQWDSHSFRAPCQSRFLESFDAQFRFACCGNILPSYRYRAIPLRRPTPRCNRRRGRGVQDQADFSESSCHLLCFSPPGSRLNANRSAASFTL